MTLDARLVVERPDFSLDVELSVDDASTIALVGPNGAGKSTVLRALCGLENLSDGHVRLDDMTLDDVDGRIHLAPERRPVAMVFQDLRLFPHMSALENAAFGLRARGTGRTRSREIAREWLERFGVARLAHRRPSQLSGGEAQRVALARALATHPRLLLLDEPMSALDPGVRAEIRADLRVHLDSMGIITVLVTHDPVDVHSLAHEVIVVEDGRVVQTGSLLDVTTRPVTRHAADLVGMVFVEGSVSDGVLSTATGAVLVVPHDSASGPACAAIRPSAVAVHRSRPEGSARNVWPMRVAEIEARADRVRLRLSGELDLVAELTPAGWAALGIAQGDDAWASVKASEIAVTPMAPPAMVSGPGSTPVH